MRTLTIMMVGAVAALGSACQPQRAPNDALDLPVKIEADVRAQRPDLDLSQYARIYARDETAEIFAVYVKGGTQHKGRTLGPGVISWSPYDGLPKINGGGCHVVNVNYDEERGGLQSVACNKEGKF